MAYIVKTELTLSDAAAASLDVPIPAEVIEDDLMVMFISQDGGPTTIAVTVNTGWTLATGTQAIGQFQRTVCFYKLAGASEVDAVLTGAADDWIVTFVVVRNAHLVTPVGPDDKVTSANSTTAFLDSVALTTTQDNTLILECWGFDGSGKFIPEIPNDITNVSKANNVNAISQYVGYRNFLTAGTTVPVRMLYESASEGGTSISIAIRDADPALPQMGPDAVRSFDPVKRYGGTTTQVAAANGFIRHDSISAWLTHTSVVPAAIGGVSIGGAATGFTEVTLANTQSPWGNFTGISQTTSGVDATGRWVGTLHTMASLDLTAKLVAVEFFYNVIIVNRQGPRGALIYFEDSTGGWAAYQLSVLKGLLANVPRTAIISIDNDTPIGTGGSFNKADVIRVGYLWHKVTTNVTAAIFYVKNFITLDRVTYVDGCLQAPVKPTFIDTVLTQQGLKDMASVQGAGQALIKNAIRLSNGTRNVYYAAAATSQEMPLPTDLLYRVPALSDGARFRINAQAGSTVDLTSCILATQVQQRFIIEATASAAASYNFAGASIIGYEINNDNTVTINLATLSGCSILSNAGGLDSCNIVAQTAPVLTSNPGLLVGNSFAANGTYGIEATTPGTFDFEGNVFTGYGADASATAAFYNNSGGLITLNIPVGGQIPTVTNGAAASTVIISPTTVIITGAQVADSVEMRRFSDSLLLETFTGSGSKNVAAHIGVNVYFRRLDGTQIIASSFPNPLVIVSGDNGTVPLFSGQEVQIGNVGDIAGQIWDYPAASATTVASLGEALAAQPASLTVINNGVKSASLLIPHTTNLP